MAFSRVLLAGLFHETHTFLPGRTVPADFAVLRGTELLARRGDSSPLGGALAAAERFGWDVVPALDCRAVPSGIVADEVVESFWREFRETATRAGRLDGVLLVLHGAMVSESLRDVEGELLGRMRALPGWSSLPLAAVFDLHAHLSPRMCEHADALVAYRENPHTDARDAAERAAAVLDRVLRDGSRSRMRLRRVPVMWPPTGTGTADEPMRSLERLARQLEAEHPNFLAVNIVGGFAFGDTPDTGVSVSLATLGPDDEADAALDRLATQAWDQRQLGNVIEPPVDDVLATLVPVPPGLTVLAEPSDNVGGGAPGDGTGLLRAFLRHGLSNAAVALCDAAAVERLRGESAGTRVTLPLGGRAGPPLDEGPVVLEVTVASHSDGRFELEDKHSHLASLAGDRFDMGPSVVVRHAGLTILLTSRPTPPMDLGQWRSQGVVPEELSFIGVKAAVAHRRAYAPIAARMLTVGTTGPCTSDLKTLPFRHVRRPIFPLDDA